MRVPRPAQQPVGVVLDDDDLVLLGQLEHAPAPLERHRRAARVLEVRDHVEEGDRLALELGRERVGVDAVAVDRHADHLGARPLQDQDAAIVGRRLDEDARRRGAGQKHVGHERERLERAVGAHDALARHAVACADPAAQALVPAGGVRERDHRLLFHRRRERGAHVIDGEHVGARHATGERDRIGHACSVGNPLCSASRCPSRGAAARPGASCRRPAGERRTRPRPGLRRRESRHCRPPRGRSRACARAAG